MGDYSFPYLTRWSEGSTDLLRETAERSTGCAKQILGSLEQTYAIPSQVGATLT